ncbi:MAG: sugar phosphate isomerase/epimerase family protein [Gemmatimonadaceae bacterium]
MSTPEKSAARDASIAPPTASLSRRDFVRLIGAGSAGLAAGLAACSRATEEAAVNAAASGASASGSMASAAVSGNADPTPLGIQLYTVRNALQADPAGVLMELGRIGYREVETAGTAGKTAAEFRAMMTRAGLTSPAGHYPIERMRSDMAGVIAEARTLGQRWIVCPWLGEDARTAAGYRALAADLNTAGAAARDAGMRVAYHNHDFEFRTPEGGRGFDTLLAETDSALVDFEMDLYWITKAGGRPLDYFAKYPGRFPLVHVKDMSASGAFADVGAGTIDFAGIFAQAGRGGVQHYFVERDDAPSAADPLASARASFTALRRLRA